MRTSDRAALRRQRLIGLIVSCWRTQALHAAVHLELPEHLAQGPRDVVSLARNCDCSFDGLQRLLRALCSLDVCRERRDGRFELTATGALLRREPPDHLQSLRGLAMWWGGHLWSEWRDLAYGVKTGRSVRATRSGHTDYDFMEGHPDMAGVFHEAMRGMTAMICEDVARLPIWRAARSVVDVGGGSGELAAALVLAHPQLTATIVDRPEANAQANALLTQRGVATRARYLVGDFFDALPAGADHYVLKSVLHNWDNERCHRILSRCAMAAQRGARLVLIERLRPARLRPTRRDESVARADLNMLIGLGGRERSLSEFVAMLTPHGFELVRTSPTPYEFSVIEAQRR